MNVTISLAETEGHSRVRAGGRASEASCNDSARKMCVVCKHGMKGNNEMARVTKGIDGSPQLIKYPAKKFTGVDGGMPSVGSGLQASPNFITQNFQ